MDAWLPCKIHIKTHRGRRRAYLVLQDTSGALEPRWHVVLLVRHPSGALFQVPGRLARRRSRGYVEVYVPIDAVLTLAAWMNVKAERSATIYGYAVQIKEVKPPAL
jgi:hypothetical protein